MPQPGEVIYDPACGTAGFLIAAHRYISEHHPKLSPAKARHLRLDAIRGAELVGEVTRLAAMNLLLHGIGPLGSEEEPPVTTQDSLSVLPSRTYDVVLTNPPFGKRSSVTVVTKRRDLDEDSLNVVRGDFWASTSNKELNFLQHVASILSENGRAAIVVPDGVLTAGGPGEIIRRRLLQDFDVHTLVRLPTGIFYGAGVNANVLFFDRKRSAVRQRDCRLWVYDFRTNTHFTLVGKRLERPDLDEFVICYNPGKREHREATWSSENQSGRWRSFSYDELIQRDRANLDLFWIADEERQLYRSPRALEELTTQIADDLRAALIQISELTAPR